MITNSFGFYLIIAGFVSLLILRFYRGKYWAIFLILGIGFFALRMSMKEVTILIGNRLSEDYLTFNRNHEYNYKNGSKEIISIEDNTLINDTEDYLVVEKLEYSTYASYTSGDNVVMDIPPYSHVQLINSIDYFYSQPPDTISVKNGGTTTRFWIHE